jgi:hypothetical protein
MAVPIDGEPYDASFLTDGIGIERPLPGAANLTAAGAPYSLTSWMRADRDAAGIVTLMAIGDGRALTDWRWRDAKSVRGAPSDFPPPEAERAAAT